MNKYLLVIGVVVVLGFIFFKMKTSMSMETGKVEAKLKLGAMVFDVRTVGEFQSGHYSGAINIPVDQVKTRISEFGSKDRPVVVYCTSGGRSASAKSILDSAGFSDVTNAGGLSDMPK